MDITPSLSDTPEYGALVADLPHFDGKSRAFIRLEHLRAAVAHRDAAQLLVDRLLDECAKDVPIYGQITTWDLVGEALGTTKQGASQAHKRWLAKQQST
jgi:hypothetical protein